MEKLETTISRHWMRGSAGLWSLREGKQMRWTLSCGGSFQIVAPPTWHHCNFTDCLGKTLTEPRVLLSWGDRVEFGEATLAKIYYISAKKEEATWKKSLYKELSLCLNTSLCMHKVALHKARPKNSCQGKNSYWGPVSWKIPRAHAGLGISSGSHQPE